MLPGRGTASNPRCSALAGSCRFEASTRRARVAAICRVPDTGVPALFYPAHGPIVTPDLTIWGALPTCPAGAFNNLSLPDRRPPQGGLPPIVPPIPLHLHADIVNRTNPKKNAWALINCSVALFYNFGEPAGPERPSDGHRRRPGCAIQHSRIFNIFN